MKRLSMGLLVLVMVMSLIGCGDSRQQEGDESFAPPIEGISWGMTLEEALKVLDIEDDSVAGEDGGMTTLQCDDLKVLGQNADVTMTFQTKPQIGLTNLLISFEDLSKEEIAELLTSRYKEYYAVNDAGIPCLWETDTKIEDLSETVQNRFRYMHVDGPSERQGLQETEENEAKWNSLKSKSLVTVTFRADFVAYYAGNMAAYLIYADDDAYEELQKYYE